MSGGGGVWVWVSGWVGVGGSGAFGLMRFAAASQPAAAVQRLPPAWAAEQSARCRLVLHSTRVRRHLFWPTAWGPCPCAVANTHVPVSPCARSPYGSAGSILVYVLAVSACGQCKCMGSALGASSSRPWAAGQHSRSADLPQFTCCFSPSLSGELTGADLSAAALLAMPL